MRIGTCRKRYSIITLMFIEVDRLKNVMTRATV